MSARPAVVARANALEGQADERAPATSAAGRSRDDLLSCPICLDRFSHAVSTSCGHAFCAACILTVWEHSSRVSPVQCPVCRTYSSLLIPAWVLRSLQLDLDGDAAQVPEENDTERTDWDTKVRYYNDLFVNQPRATMSLQTVREDAVTLQRGVSRSPVVGMIVCTDVIITLLYLFNALPWELIPDTDGIKGFFDEIFVFLMCLFVLLVVSRVLRSIIIRQLRTARR